MAKIVFVLFIIIASVASAPTSSGSSKSSDESSTPSATSSRNSRSLLPFWHLPCGQVIESEISNDDNLIEGLKSVLISLKLQHELTMNDYLSRDYEFLYERVRIGVHEHQYIPNWVPGKKDVHIVKKIAGKNPQTVSI